MRDLLSIDVDLLSASFECATRHEGAFAHLFYSLLLDRYPEAASLFGEGVSVAQERMLASAIVAVLAHLDDPPWLLSRLPELGRQHGARGVRAEMYGWFSECLLDALSASCAENWSRQADSEWSAALTLISTLMLSGCEED